jgi:uncharacterized membrane protein YqjE
MLEAAQAIATNLLGLARVRLELLGAELEQELTRFAAVVLAGLIAVGLAMLGIAFAAVAFLLALEAEHRLMAATFAGGLFLAAGGALAWRIRREVNLRPAAFTASIGQLERDCAALRGAVAQASARMRAASGSPRAPCACSVPWAAPGRPGRC